MVELGCSLTVLDRIGRTPLHYLVQMDFQGDTIKWFLAKVGEDPRADQIVNTATVGGVTALMLATKRNNAIAVNLLLNAKANPFLVDQLQKEAKDYSVSMVHEIEKTYPIT